MSSRQSAFPGILVEEVRVSKPPFDEPGVVQEFVGRGVTREFEALKKAGDFTDETVGEILDSVEDMIGPLRDTYQIEYVLLVRSLTDNTLSKRGAKARARAFTRAKNPFEPEIVEVRSVSVDQDLSGKFLESTGGRLGTIYRVRTAVTK